MLHLLGWTQQAIADAVGLDRTTVSVIVKNFNSKLFNDEFTSGMKPWR